MRNNSNDQFVHLHVHSIYSKFDGTCFIPGLYMECARHGMPGFALTDHGTIRGVRELFETARQFPTIKPIAGCEIYLTDHYDHKIKDDDHVRCFHLILLAKNIIGFRNLEAIVDASWKEGYYKGRPRISHEAVAAHGEGLVCTSACIGGEISQAILADDLAAAGAAINWYKSIFGDDFYLEVDLHPNFEETRIYPQQKIAAKWIYILGQKFGVKVVAANDVHFIAKEEAEFHDMMLCEKTHSDPKDPNRFRYTGQEWFKDFDEMDMVFIDHPEVLANTMEIFNKIERFKI